MSEPMTKPEFVAVMKQLVIDARVTEQSVRDCERRGAEMADQLPEAQVKLSGILKAMEILTTENTKSTKGGR
jgi:hypothetical protein